MTIASRIADRLVLKPSRQPIDPEDRKRIWIELPNGRIEVWVKQWRPPSERGRMLVLKFPGAGGRAERGGPHPLECWPETGADIWTVNMPGYGGSDGKATLRSITPAADAVWHALQQQHPGAQPLIVGNSIGCSAGLFVAAHHPVAGLLLRNPVPLRELIEGQHGWWNGGRLARWLTHSLPSDLDPVANAIRCRAPAFFFQSAADRLVPPKYQDMVISPYGGPHSVFRCAGIDHHERTPESQENQYRQSIQWLIDHCNVPAARNFR